MQNPFSPPANQNQPPLSGKLSENIMHFARVLREAGVPVGPGAVIDALDAAMSGSLRTRDDFYWTLHAVMVKRRIAPRIRQRPRSLHPEVQVVLERIADGAMALQGQATHSIGRF